MPVFSAGGAYDEWVMVEGEEGEARWCSTGADATTTPASEGVMYSRPSKGSVRKMMGKAGGSARVASRMPARPEPYPTRASAPA